MKRAMTTRFALLACLSALSACGGGITSKPFSTDWTDDGGKSIEQVRRDLARAPIPPGAPPSPGSEPG